LKIFYKGKFMDLMRCPPNVQLGNFLKCPTTIGEVKGRYNMRAGARAGARGVVVRGERGEISFC
jgi:hypothetical protein